MTRVGRRTSGWLGILFVVLLFLNAVMVTLPSSDDSIETVAGFYRDNRAVILLAQAIGLIAAPLFVVFAFGLQEAVSGPRGSAGVGAIGTAGVLVAIVSVATAIPVIVLSSTTSGMSFWLRMTDLTDAFLFSAIAVFTGTVALRGEGAPVWFRVFSLLIGLLALARGIAGFAGVSSGLDLAAPLGFIALVLVSSIFLLSGSRTPEAAIS